MAGPGREPEHPYVRYERRRDINGIVFGLGVMILIFGIFTYSFAGYAERSWTPGAMPASVRQYIDSEYLLSYALIAAGALVTAGTWIRWRRIKRDDPFREL